MKLISKEKFENAEYEEVNLDFKDLIGKTLRKIEVDKDKTYINFYTIDGYKFIMNHHQSCCEYVRVEDINGDLDDLLNNEILQAEVNSNNENYNDYESCTWTFYKLATIKGYVTIRWLGTSNGYYSESVDLDVYKIKI